jgi:HD-GYP domain-containing protein (c-di-GMP phosphodiesterase class II)
MSMKDATPRTAHWANAATSLGNLLAAPGPADEAEAIQPLPEDEAALESAPLVAPPSGLRWAVRGLLAITLVIALLSDPNALLDHPGLAVALAVVLVALDRMRIDIFDRAQVSPAGVMSLALAFLFGPLGVLFAEALVAGDRAVRRVSPTRIGFDLSNQVLAGTASFGVYVALHDSLGTIGAATAGALANYLVSASLLSVVLSVMGKTSLRATWGEQFAWLWVHYLAFGALAGGLVLMHVTLGVWAVALFTLPIAVLWIAEHQYLSRSRRSVSELRSRNAELEVAHKQLSSALDDRQQLLERAHTSYLRTITTLGRAVQARDPYAMGRCERVTRIAQRLADELGFGAEERHAIAVGVICADIGKVGIPDRLLTGRGELSLADHKALRSYPEISAFILDELDVPTLVKEMARNHLERWDGAGSPDRLAGEDIPMAARILAVADALDHKTSEGPGRAALTLDHALSEFAMETGTRFCPTVVGSLRNCLNTDPALRSYFGGDAFIQEGTPYAA